MANLPLTEIVVPGSQDVLELAPDLSAEVSALQSAVNTLNTEVSSIPNGTYPNLTAGSILTDKYDTDTTPYLYRAMPYVSKRLEDVLVGGSVVWNQLCNATSVTITSGHKYYMKKDGTETVGASDGTALTGLTVGTDIVRDLTQMLGSTIADYINSLGSTDGVAFLKRYFITIGVYDSYDTGTIKSVEATAHVTVGKNLYDKSKTNTSNGYRASYYVKGMDGTESSSATYNISEYFRVLPNTEYTISGTYGTQPGICFYDGNKNFISGLSYGVAQATPYKTFTTPSNAVYARCSIVASLVDELQLEIGGTQTAYKPYEAHTYPLGDVVLRGIPKLVNNELVYDGDIYTHDGSVNRIYDEKIFDGSSDETITLQAHYDGSSHQHTVFVLSISNLKPQSGGSLIDGMNVYSPYIAKYINDNAVDNDWTVRKRNSSKQIFVFAPTSLGDITLEAFKAQLASYPLAITYEKDTPTTETTTPFEQYQVCETGGTEEYTTNNDVPVGHETKYFTDVIGNIENIPAPPTTNGTYTLQVTVSASGNTYAWV